MKDIQNNKTIGVIAILALVIGLVTLAIAFFSDTKAADLKNTLYETGGLALALALILFVLKLQMTRRAKKKKNRYHAVHWNNGHISKD